ncbi:MAG: hypothetical protein JEZ09_15860 [Salinivirgaceae bacterium]|nr:hypothetical protein [Salinivirgaceae bacterium]
MAEIQKGHLTHINKMANKGKLILSDPFDNGSAYKGILIFDVETVEEVIVLQGGDPTVKTGKLELKVIPWWGAKAFCLP